METIENTRRKRSLIPLVFLVLLFALPPLLGWVFYLNPHWLPGGRVNRGTLIEPVRSVDSLILNMSGDPQMLDWQSLRDQWILTVVNRGNCEAPCVSRLIEIRQLRRALAADRKRVSRLLILLPDESGRVIADPPLPGLEGTHVTYIDPENLNEVVSVFDLERVRPEDYIFLIDPRGALMMRHQIESVKPQEILKDLQMLLKASANWVTGEQ